MNNMYTSLMLDTLYKRVEGAEEIKKSNAVSQQFLTVLEEIPSFRSMVRERLIKTLSEYHPGVLLDKIFINRGNADFELGIRPQGVLLDVYVECLSRNIAPNYIVGTGAGSDGVYDRPNTTDARYKLSELNLDQIERIINNARQSLEREHRTSLEKYWQAVSKTAPASTHKVVLQGAFSRVLMAQLSLSVMGKRLELHQGENAAKFLVSGFGRSLYKVLVDDAAQPSVRLPCGFVVDMANRGSPLLALDSDHYGCLLYTPAFGFEYFLSSNDVHAALCSRLTVSGNAISYPQLQTNVFDYCADSLIKHQQDELSRLLRSREHYEAGKMPALESIQRLAMVRQNGLTNFDSLRAAISRGEWPEWLRTASDAVQENYLQLEASMRKYDEAFQRTYAPYFSLQAFARKTVADWSASALGRTLDSDTVQVLSTYEMKLAGKTVRQEDIRSLTELVAFGTHDEGYAAKLSLIGAQSTGLTADKLASG
jgi:hypothetical protein